MCRKLISTVLAAALCAGVAAPSLAADGYNDYDAITSHVNLKVPARLTLTRPEKDVSTSAAAYFITGGSDPDEKLTMNGEAVSGRGARGSFGVLVALQKGVNTFVFRNGGRSEEINITRGADTPVTITNIRGAAPSFDCATYSGETISLQCTAPSGAQVTATVGGRQVALKQAAATAVAGVPATFSAKTTAGEVDGTRNLHDDLQGQDQLGQIGGQRLPDRQRQPPVRRGEERGGKRLQGRGGERLHRDGQGGRGRLCDRGGEHVPPVDGRLDPQGVGAAVGGAGEHPQQGVRRLLRAGGKRRILHLPRHREHDVPGLYGRGKALCEALQHDRHRGL